MPLNLTTVSRTREQIPRIEHHVFKRGEPMRYVGYAFKLRLKYFYESKLVIFSLHLS